MGNAACASSCSQACGETTSQQCSCAYDCYDREDLLCCHDFSKMCLPMGTSAVEVDCHSVRHELGQVSAVALVMLICCLAPGPCLSCFAWWSGMSLWRRLDHGEHLTLLNEHRDE